MTLMSTLRTTLVGLVAASVCSASLGRGMLDRIAEKGQINLGYSESSAPFSFKIDGAPVGYSVDICRSVAERIKQETGKPQLQVNFVPVDSDQLLRVVGSGFVDVMCGAVSDTPLRRKFMAFSSPIFLTSVKLLVRESGPRALADLRKGTVAVLGRTTAESAVSGTSASRGMSLKVSRVVNPEAALSQLRLKQADAWARDEVLLLGAVERWAEPREFRLLDDVLSTEIIALAMPPDDKLAAVVDKALAAEVRSGRIDDLYDRWFVQPNPMSKRGLNLPMSPGLRFEFDKLRR